MSVLMPSAWIATLLAATALLAMLRLARRHRQLGRTRLAMLLLAQPLLAALLYFALFPPRQSVASGTLTVLTAGGSAPAAAGIRIALPEAPIDADAEPMPDLANALRRHPGMSRLQVLGDGLEARDLEAARTLPLAFVATPAPVGLVELQAPTQVAAGNVFAVSGRVAGLPDATVELRDPAGQRVQHARLDAQGRFALQGQARAAGLATFSLRVLARGGRRHEALPLPLRVDAPPSPRLLVMAGAPTPELKYLRRWAIDAGLELRTRISTGGDVSLGEAPVALDAAQLGRVDAVLLDVRSLRALGGGERAALTAAIRDGLGVVLRIDEPLQTADRARLRAWGYALDAGIASESARLPGDPALPALSRRVLRIDGGDAVTLLRDARDRPLATWRTLGRGRVAVLVLDDSYALALGGYASRHADLWSRVLAAVARTRTPAGPLPPEAPLWPDERASACGLGDGARVLAPGGDTVALRVDPATGVRRCAAFWPRTPGWHVLRDGDTTTPFAVLPADAGTALRAQRRRDATHALAARQSLPPDGTGMSRRGPSWPWLAAWLLLATLAWWLERRPIGAGPVPAATIA
ncbi:carboxypeptidase regulatory-like domain-containing protein [Thermomonas sp.]|uniref:carboxypeptidase regulatory-like domain-containing protein n=1 Tax=Thermomonas sp. TaxID=1971895 RepID=UPI0035AF306C